MDTQEFNEEEIEVEDQEGLEQFLEQMKQLEKEMKESEPIPTQIISIDPGFKNFAHVVGDYIVTLKEDSKVILIQVTIPENKMKCTDLIEMKSAMGSELMRAMKSWYYQNFDDYKDSGKMKEVIIEEQYIQPPYSPKAQQTWLVQLKLKLVEHMALAMFEFGKSTMATLVNSKELKSNLAISTGNHANNKQAALRFLKEGNKITNNKALLSPEDYAKLQNNDHIADCIVQIYYYLRTSFERLHPDCEVQLEFKILPPVGVY